MALAVLSSGCVFTAQQATDAALRRATQAGFKTELVEGRGFTHSVFTRVRADAAPIWVFVEGDGSPWTHAGTQIAPNPTARSPLALELALQTPNAIYLGRPCYLRGHDDARCNSQFWTGARYSDAVVRSMNAALQATLKNHPNNKVVLVGYSGGGTLAVLMAQTLPRVAVVTIAGNLDTAEWARQHGFTALAGRNPADEAPLPAEIEQFYSIGGQDENVTESMAARYLSRVRSERIWRYEKFGHVCCWEEAWQEILSKVSTRLEDH